MKMLHSGIMSSQADLEFIVLQFDRQLFVEKYSLKSLANAKLVTAALANSYSGLII